MALKVSRLGAARRPSACELFVGTPTGDNIFLGSREDGADRLRPSWQVVPPSHERKMGPQEPVFPSKRGLLAVAPILMISNSTHPPLRNLIQEKCRTVLVLWIISSFWTRSVRLALQAFSLCSIHVYNR